MSSADPKHSMPTVPLGPNDSPASPTSVSHTFLEVYSEVLVDDPSECSYDSDLSECHPGDSASQAGPPASVAINVDYF